MRRILQGTRFAHSANKPTDAAAGQSVRNILKGMANALQGIRSWSKLIPDKESHRRKSSLMKIHNAVSDSSCKGLAFKASPER